MQCVAVWSGAATSRRHPRQPGGCALSFRQLQNSRRTWTPALPRRPLQSRWAVTMIDAGTFGERSRHVSVLHCRTFVPRTSPPGLTQILA